MKNLSELRKTLKHLLAHRAKHCVSVYTPLEVAGPDVQKNPIVLKNHFKAAQSLLDRDEGERLREAMAPLTASECARRIRSPGLALFHSDGVFETYQVPWPIQPLVTVGDRFHLKPLIALLGRSCMFHILTLSRNDVRLLVADSWGVRRVPTNGALPAPLASIAQRADGEKQLQFHSGAGRVPVHHGQGKGEHREHEDLRRYLTAVDAGIRSLLGARDAPLVLAGVGELTSTFRWLTQYPNVVDNEVPGNVDALADQDLYQRALPLARLRLQEEHRRIRRRAVDVAHTERATTNLKDAALAAQDGRIEKLFVRSGACRWGHVNPQTRSISRERSQTRDNEDLLDAIAVKTFEKGGDVFIVDEPQMPVHDAPLLALFRY